MGQSSVNLVAMKRNTPLDWAMGHPSSVLACTCYLGPFLILHLNEFLKADAIDNLPRILNILFAGGLLDRSTARYFYKRLKTSLHKPRDNLLENLFSKKCAFKINLQLLEKKFLSQTNTTPKNSILLIWPICRNLQYFSNCWLKIDLC